MRMRDHIANEKYASFDFHIHSKCSYDSLLQPKKILRVAERRGLNGVAITDHNTINGSVYASKINSPIQVIIGSEIKTEKGDVIGLFLNEEIVSRTFDEVIEEIKDQGGVVVLPHPYKETEYIPNEVLDKVDVIEVMNGRSPHMLNEKARILAKSKHMPICGGSDAHIAMSVGSVRTVFNCEDKNYDLDEIKALLLNNDIEVIGTESPRYVHYFSATIGNVRKKKFLKLGRLFVQELYSIVRRI